ncbi:uncharacterized protein LOC124407965 [Diprion similis]|uniref:uncharacterized protein LOC124407965 n=1 Tax=Diprion similis TaxID=362088 RepID=UPI001EF8E074|nr:uncharacterized protein LOC124407965 [Diprion similis]
MARERYMMAKELEFARRELALLSREIVPAPREPVREQLVQQNHNINAMKELIGDFKGGNVDFRKWEEQFKLLCRTYQLDDAHARLLLSAKLKGNASQWFQSKPEYIGMKVGVLLHELAMMFDHRPNRLARRKKFEDRIWKALENFSDYYHDKIILGSDVPIDEEELVDYLIDGIPNTSIQTQARIQRFREKASLLDAFDKVKLPPEKKIFAKSEAYGGENTKATPVASEHKASLTEKKPVDTFQSPRCFNCSKNGHLAFDCKLPRRAKGACLKCFAADHQLPDCPKVKREQISFISEPDGANFYKIAEFDVKVGKSRCLLDTLLDTGSPISLIKQQVVLNVNIDTTDIELNQYVGLNNSNLEIRGKIRANVRFDGLNCEDIDLRVVPDSTMKTSIILGREVLKKLNLELKTPAELEEEVVQEPFNIETCSIDVNVAESILINPGISREIQSAVRRLLTTDYLSPERPIEPQVQGEISLTLTSDKPLYFSRLAFTEKEQLKKILDKLLENGTIRPSESPYASPIVLVKKSNREFRLCIDYRFLNKIIERDNYPLPLIEDQIDTLRDKKYYSLLDLKDGFHHIKVTEDSIKYTSFVIPLGQLNI